MLQKAESDLRNYNEWIVGTFIRNSPGIAQTNAQILDFGAGIGTLSQLYAARSGVKPSGVELDATQRAIFAGRGFRAFASLADTPGQYDLIFTSNVLEHIEDDKRVLLQLRAKLREDGLLLIYVPAFEAIWTSMDDKVGHYRRYHRKDLVAKLDEAGFRVRKVHYCDSLGFMLAILFKFIGSKNGEPSSASLRIYDRFLLPVSKAMDILFSRLFGKNIFAVAELRKATGL